MFYYLKIVLTFTFYSVSFQTNYHMYVLCNHLNISILDHIYVCKINKEMHIELLEGEEGSDYF